MKKLSFGVIVALATFCIGVSCVSIWLIQKYSQSQQSRLKVPLELKIPSDTLITLERTGCYGTCPSYTLTIAADGSVVFNATSYWVREGKASRLKESGVILSNISEEQLRQLIAAFEKADYFSLRDSYTSNEDCPGGVSTDMPSAYTSIQINGRRKGVSHNLGCVGKGEGLRFYPDALIELEKKIDGIVNTKQWMQ